MANETLAAPLLTGVIVLLSTIVGAFAAYFATRTQRREDRKVERVAIAVGIAAEVEAYIDLVTRRNYSDLVRHIIGQLNAGQNISLSTLLPSSGSIKELFPLSFSQLDKVGVLGEETYDLARFLTSLAGVLATIELARSGAFEYRSNAEKSAMLQAELDLWENTLRLGRHLSQRLKSFR